MSITPSTARADPMELWALPSATAVRKMQQGTMAPEDYLASHLARIEATEPSVRAWENLDSASAIAQAQRVSRVPLDARAALPLFGLPVGVKDVIDVEGLPTGAGFEPYRGRPATSDAAVIARMRRAGAIIVGKTTTTQFAWGQDPPKTRNPWNLEHTPGGSSSGSPAALAAGHIQIGVGTQTASSLLRPASYCGVVGLKPSYGRISCKGIFPTSWTSDHPGFVARSVLDVAVALDVCSGHDPEDPHSARIPVESYAAAAATPRQPRLGVLIDYLERSTPEVQRGFESAVQILGVAGAKIEKIHLPVDLDLIMAIHWATSNAEAVTSHASQFAHHAEHYLPTVRLRFEVGHLIPAMAYVQARRAHRRIRPQMRAMFEGIDAIIAPTSSDRPPRLNPPPKERPLGDTTFQLASSAFGYPAITLPAGLGPDALPYAVQLFAPAFHECALLGAAAWCEAALPALPAPLQ